MFEKRQPKSYEQVEQECIGKSQQEISQEIEAVHNEAELLHKVPKRDLLITIGLLCATIGFSIHGFMNMDLTVSESVWNGDKLAILGCGAGNVIMMAKAFNNLKRLNDNDIDLIEAEYKAQVLEELSKGE